MSKPPLPEAAVAMLRKPNPAVITTLRPDGQPVSTATWYLWDDGRVLVWTAPGILEALIPGRMQGHGGTAEVPR